MRCPSSLRALFPTFATASSPCKGASYTRCAKWGWTPASSTANAPVSSAKCSRVTIRTATPRSTTRSFAWRKISRFAIRWLTDTATSGRSIPTGLPPIVTPRRVWPAPRWTCWPTSTKKRFRSFPTSTTRAPSRASCRAGFRSCCSTGRAVSRSAWRRTFRRTTWARSPTRSPCFSTTRTPTTTRCATSSRAPTFRRAARSSGKRRSALRTRPAAVRS